MLGALSRPRSRVRSERAFTLVELLIAVAVVAVLLTLAGPSLRDFILMQRLKSVHAQLITDLQYARSEAVSSGAVVNMRVQLATGSATQSCYILFHHYSWDYVTNGASSGLNTCSCRQPAGSRCPTSTDHRELRTVQIPTSDGLRLRIPVGQTKSEVAFDPRTGGMVLSANEAGLGTGSSFAVNVSIDTARTLSAVVGVTGRPGSCRPASSSLPGPAC